jgi:hypothetical protein
MSQDGKSQISLAALSEVQAALKKYCAVILSSDLSPSSQDSYIDQADRFVRWIRGDFIPGSRMEPYRKTKTENVAASLRRILSARRAHAIVLIKLSYVFTKARSGRRILGLLPLKISTVVHRFRKSPRPRS